MITTDLEESRLAHRANFEESNTQNIIKENLSRVQSKTNLYHQLGLTEIESSEQRALHKLSSVEKKMQGVFFTPADLSNLSVKKLSYTVQDGPILDPACGTGNLLLTIAESFKTLNSLEDTLTAWNSHLYGIDINSEFIDIAKRKIVKLAISKGAAPHNNYKIKDYTDLLSNIKSGDFLNEYHKLKGSIGCIIMNPPFFHMDSPNDIKWTSGKLNVSALFISYALEILPENGKLLGILPDVLRSGTRYSKWRDSLSLSSAHTMESFGNFKSGVQVDVFILNGVKKQSVPPLFNEGKLSKSAPVLMDLFDISVGPVVPHRDQTEGKENPFAHAKILPAWETIDELLERVTHSGKKFLPPFVAVRRTSSPKDKYRAVGTIVNCIEPVAVENHIIVISPKDKTLTSCQKLLNFLKTEHVNNYINSEIRCRHLTVGVIKKIPIEGMSDGY